MGVDLAVDGGQSGLRMALVEADTDRPRAGTSVQAPGFAWGAGVDLVTSNVEAITGAWRELGSPGPVSSIACGLSGGPIDHERRTRLGAELIDRLGASRAIITGDDVITHAGALAGQTGVVLAAGTGVVCTAIDAAGRRVRTDAWGYLFGDAGGGSWLGQRGLRAAMAASEGRKHPTKLTDRAVERFGELRAFVHRVLAAPTLVTEVASFARDVLALADAGDEVAAALCSRAANELATTVAATVRRAYPDAESHSVPFTWTGSIVLTGETVRLPMLARLAELCPQASPRPPLGNGLDGAALLATTSGTAHHAISTEFPAAP
ncbi:MAG: N-acetylglucosamine kinase [Nocardioidaceae bacterium]